MSDRFQHDKPRANGESWPSLTLFQGVERPLSDSQILYRDSGPEFHQAIKWLAEAPDNFLIKFTGGCLKMDPREAAGFYELIIEAFAGGHGESSFCGALLGGATISELASDPSIRRPSVPEVVPLLQRVFPSLRSLGVVPGAESRKLDNGELLVTTDLHEGREWKVMLDPYQSRSLLVSEKTPYLWEAEGQAAGRIQQALNIVRPLRGAVMISFDGGFGTHREIEKWLACARRGVSPQVILITGSDPERTTDALASNQIWMRKHKGLVHVVPKNALALGQMLSQLKAFRSNSNTGSDSECTAA